MLKAKDIMKIETVAVTGEMTVEELGRLFIEKDISGAPVIDKNGMLVGIVTENDLISREKRLHIPTMLRLFDAFIPLEGTGAMEREIRKMSASTVSDICTKDVITVSEDTTIEDIATAMAENRVHLLPVVRPVSGKNKLVGIVGRHEVLKGISG